MGWPGQGFMIMGSDVHIEPDMSAWMKHIVTLGRDVDGSWWPSMIER